MLENLPSPKGSIGREGSTAVNKLEWIVRGSFIRAGLAAVRKPQTQLMLPGEPGRAVSGSLDQRGFSAAEAYEAPCLLFYRRASSPRSHLTCMKYVRCLRTDRCPAGEMNQISWVVWRKGEAAEVIKRSDSETVGSKRVTIEEVGPPLILIVATYPKPLVEPYIDAPSRCIKDSRIVRVA